jgi:hypothetical protein
MGGCANPPGIRMSDTFRAEHLRDNHFCDKRHTKIIMMVSWGGGKLNTNQLGRLDVMKSLVGKNFAIAERRYRIVDVQQVGGDAMVYAEPFEAADPATVDAKAVDATLSRRAPRTAFHYGDIAALLEMPGPA